MKFLKITTIVLGLHATLIALLVFQPGCNTSTSPKDRYYEPMNQGDFTLQDNSSTQSFADDFLSSNAPVNTQEVHTPEQITDYHGSYYPETATRSETLPTHQESTVVDRYPPTRPSWNMHESRENFATTSNHGRVDVLKPSSTARVEQKSMSHASDELTTNDATIKTMETATSSSSSYTVKAGDTLWVIAKRNDLTLTQLLDANPSLTKKSILRIGQEIMLPSKNQQNRTTQSSKSTTAEEIAGGTYTIRKGDTLSGIANRFKVTVAALRSANSIAGNTIYAGKPLTIPGVDNTTIAAIAQPELQQPHKQPEALDSISGYKVQSGESLSLIAKRFNVTVADLMKWNNINDARKLRAGQSLRVTTPDAQATSVVPVTTPTNLNQVRNFDTMLPTIEEESNPNLTRSDSLTDDSLFQSSEATPLVSAIAG